MPHHLRSMALFAALIAALVGVSACKGKQTGVTASALSQQASSLYAKRCATCHGASGKGDGASSAMLNPKPRSFADPAWQKAMTDEALDTVILQGGAAVGKSAVMPPNPDLSRQPALLGALRQHIRGFVK